MQQDKLVEELRYQLYALVRATSALSSASVLENLIKEGKLDASPSFKSSYYEEEYTRAKDKIEAVILEIDTKLKS